LIKKAKRALVILAIASLSLHLGAALPPPIAWGAWMSQAGTGIFRVAPSGTDTSGCGSEALPCRTIQYAVNLASSGDTILVARGTYVYSPATDICSSSLGTTGVVCVVNKQLTILGGYTSSDWSNPDPTTNVTIIDGQDTYRGVFVTDTLSSATALNMEGFTIRNGQARGIPARPGDDQINAFGGGMLVEFGRLTLRDMVFESNSAIGESTTSAYGGSAGGGGLAMRFVPSGTLERLTFTENQALANSGSERGGYAIGGGLYTYYSIVSGRYITLTDNTAVGGSCDGDGELNGEYADAQGGGAAIQEGSEVDLQYVVATGNTAVGGAAPYGNAGGAFGGALFAERSTFTLTDAYIFGNVAQGGDGVNANALIGGTGFGQGGGMATIHANVTLNRTAVINNTAKGGTGATHMGSAGGGGVAFSRIEGDTTVQIANSIIADNLAQMGGGQVDIGGGAGGLWLQGVYADIVHTTFARNRLSSASMQGQAIALLSIGTATPTTANISYTIIAEHTNNSGAAAIHAQPNNTVNLYRGLFAGNTNDTNNEGDPTPPGTFTGLGTMLSARSAGFVASGAPDYDYHILTTSAARDQATGSSTTVDIDNESRTLFAPPDIGADECVPIVLAVSREGSGTLRPNWETNTDVVTGIGHYSLVFSYEPGANPPDQGGSPIDVGIQTSYTLTGLSNYKRYTMTIEARGANGALIASSNTVTAFPTDIFVYIPVALRNIGP